MGRSFSSRALRQDTRENPGPIEEESSFQRPQKGEGFPGQRIVVLPRAVIVSSLQHPLLSALVPTDVGIFPKAAGHTRERKHGVNQAIFIYCAKGQGWCEMRGVRHTVRAGDLLVIPPDTPHVYGADWANPWSIPWVHAAGTSVPFYLHELGVSAQRPLIYLRDHAQVRALFEELLEVVEHGYTPSHLLYASQTLAHLLGLMIWHRQQASRGTADPQQKIGQTINFMKQHLEKPLHIPALAGMANLSSSHYSALFKKQTGYAPIDYFIRLRMHQACQLLDTTAMSVKEIAATLGYDDAFYFSRAFKSVNEVSPTQYRMMHKG